MIGSYGNDEQAQHDSENESLAFRISRCIATVQPGTCIVRLSFSEICKDDDFLTELRKDERRCWHIVAHPSNFALAAIQFDNYVSCMLSVPGEPVRILMAMVQVWFP